MASTADLLVSPGRDPEPFTLTLNGGEPLHCRRVVRALPGKRLVCLARWQTQKVFAKLYFGRGAKRYWQRELDGLQALEQHGIAGPRIVFAGTAQVEHAFAVLLEPIRHARSLKEVWGTTVEEGERAALLASLAGVFARLHGAGLEQQDPHLNNFLLSAGRLYTLDGGAIRIFRRALGAGRSLDNLALLFATLQPADEQGLDTAFAVYCTRRGWSSEQFKAQLQQRIIRHRRKRRDRYLKKIFRECTAFRCRRELRRYTVYRRSYGSPELETLLTNPDASLKQTGARLLKAGNTCTVWSTPVGEHRLVIKRYNLKNSWHALSRSWRRTRAAISWENAHRLEHYGIATPAPIALVEERLGPLRRRAYFITEAVEGASCREFFSEERADSQEGKVTMQAVSALLARLSTLKISHGDMKAWNIILGPNGPTVIDLDALREHRWQWLFRRCQRRDLRRFLANWRDRPRLAHLFRQALAAHGLDDR